MGRLGVVVLSVGGTEPPHPHPRHGQLGSPAAPSPCPRLPAEWRLWPVTAPERGWRAAAFQRAGAVAGLWGGRRGPGVPAGGQL